MDEFIGEFLPPLFGASASDKSRFLWVLREAGLWNVTFDLIAILTLNLGPRGRARIFGPMSFEKPTPVLKLHINQSS